MAIFKNSSETQILEKNQTSLDSSWLVLIYDDPVNLMEYVSLVIQKVLGYHAEKAEALMLEVHNKGRAIVWSGNKEKAEFFVQQLQTFQLTAALEKL